MHYASYLRPAPVGQTNVLDGCMATAVALTFSVGRLFFASMVLKATRSVVTIVFHAVAVRLNSFEADSHVLIIAFVGGMSIPFCEIGPSTVL